MTQTDPFGSDGTGAPTTTSAVQFDVDTLKSAGTGAKVALGGALVTFLAAFMTWATGKVDGGDGELGELFSFKASVSGFKAGDGKLTILMALGVGTLVVLQLVKGWNKGMAIGAIACAAISALIGLSNWADIKGSVGDVPAGLDISVSAGLGLYLTILAGFAMVAGTVMHLRQSKAAPADTTI